MITVVVGPGHAVARGREHDELGPGDSVYIDKDVVHGSYNDFDRARRSCQVVLAPAVGDGGYVAVDVSGEEPWVVLHDEGGPRPRGRRARVRGLRRPGRRAGRGRRRAEAPPRVNRRDLLVRNPPGPAYEFPLPLVPGSDGAGIRRDTGEEVVIYPGLRLGRARGRGRAGLADPRRAVERHVRGARQGAGGERLPEARTLLVGGGGRVPARRADGLSGAVRGRTAARRRDGARSSAPAAASRRSPSSWRRRRARACSSRRRAQEKIERAKELGAARRRALHRGGLGGGARPGRRRPRLGRLDLARVAARRCAGAVGSSSSAVPAGRR